MNLIEYAAIINRLVAEGHGHKEVKKWLPSRGAHLAPPPVVARVIQKRAGEEQFVALEDEHRWPADEDLAVSPYCVRI